MVSASSLAVFVNVRKGAGTHLIHLLRRGYLLQLLDVRTVVRKDGVFKKDDSLSFTKCGAVVDGRRWRGVR